MSEKAKNPSSDAEARKNLLLNTQKSNDNEELRNILDVMPLTRDLTCGFGCLKGSLLQK